MERARAYEARVRADLHSRCAAAEEAAGMLQSRVHQLQEGYVRLQERCDELQAADQDSRRALQCCDAARQAAEDRAVAKTQECRAYVTERVVSARVQRGQV